MHKGAANRKVSGTAGSAASNRSHCVLRIAVESSTELESHLSRVAVGHLMLVDLAGGAAALPPSRGAANGQTPTSAPADDVDNSLANLMRVVSKVRHVVPPAAAPCSMCACKGMQGRGQLAMLPHKRLHMHATYLRGKSGPLLNPR